MSVEAEGSEDFAIIENIAIFDKTSGYLQKFNPFDNSWKQMQKMNEAMMRLWYFSTVCVGNYIYVMMQNKSVYRLYYSDESAAWERMGDMFDDHGCCPPAVVMQNSIYIIGGHDNCSTKSVEKYDTSSGTWTKLADKPQASQWSTPVVLNGEIYSCGGYVNEKYTNAVDRFNPKSSVWDSVAPMNEAKDDIAVVAFDGKIYALGGTYLKLLATVECYDPNRDSWTLLKSLHTARSRFHSFVIKREIYAVGGYIYSSLNSIEKYNPEKNVWVDVEMPSNMKIQESVKIRVKY